MASCDSRGIKKSATNTHEYVLIFLAIGYRDSRVDRESVTFFSAPFRSRTDRTADEGTGVVPIKNPGAGRTSAPRDDPQVWREEREAQRQPVTVAGPGTWGQRNGSSSGKPTGAAARRISGNNNHENQKRKTSG